MSAGAAKITLLAIRPGIWWILCLATACAWGMQSSPSSQPAPGPVHTPSAQPADHRTESPTPGGVAEPGPSATAPAAPSAPPAVPPKVSLADGKLTVDANNSDLSAILQDVAHAGGMTIDGLGKTNRVFGVYGPGAPRDVIAELLAGAGYNFVMLGGANGAVPRELVLTAQSSAPLANPPAPSSNDDQSDDSDSAYRQPPPPGAILHPRPLQPDDPQSRMQQRLQNLHEMQQRLQQQDQQQDSPQ